LDEWENEGGPAAAHARAPDRPATNQQREPQVQQYRQYATNMKTA